MLQIDRTKDHPGPTLVLFIYDPNFLHFSTLGVGFQEWRGSKIFRVMKVSVFKGLGTCIKWGVCQGRVPAQIALMFQETPVATKYSLVYRVPVIYRAYNIRYIRRPILHSVQHMEPLRMAWTLPSKYNKMGGALQKKISRIHRPRRGGLAADQRQRFAFLSAHPWIQLIRWGQSLLTVTGSVM